MAIVAAAQNIASIANPAKRCIFGILGCPPTKPLNMEIFLETERNFRNNGSHFLDACPAAAEHSLIGIGGICGGFGNSAAELTKLRMILDSHFHHFDHNHEDKSSRFSPVLAVQGTRFLCGWRSDQRLTVAGFPPLSPPPLPPQFMATGSASAIATLDER